MKLATDQLRVEMKKEYDSKLKAEMVRMLKESAPKKQFKVAPPKKDFTSPTRPITSGVKSPTQSTIKAYQPSPSKMMTRPSTAANKSTVSKSPARRFKPEFN